jgi:DNA polymerase-1
MTKLAEKPGTQDDGELFLVDGSGYIFRAFFALPQNLTNPEGVPVGAVLGFCNMLLKLLTDLHAPYIAVIFDAARRNFRNDIYAEYKANRDETPSELIPQFPLIREATEAFGIPALEIDGFEADDLIATYARMACAAGKKVTIVGSDKDLMQLVCDDVRLYDPIKSRYLGAEDVMEKFGVAPNRVVDVQALAGDTSDNVPGVPGIGIKTAAQLITEYGDLEGLLSRLSEIKQEKRREKLIEHAEMARISKKLVTLDCNAKVPLALEELRTRELGRPELAAFLKKHGFKSVLARVGVTDISSTSPAQAEALTPASGDARSHGQGKEELPPASQNKYTCITDIAVLEQWVARAYETGAVAFDTETTGLTPAKAELVGLSLSTDVGSGAYIPVGHSHGVQDLLGERKGDIPQLPLKDVIAALKPLLEDPGVLKIGHNVKYDWQVMAAHGIEMNPCDDTMLLSYVLDGTEHGHGMDELAQIWCGHQTIKYEDVTGKGKSQIGFAQVPLDRATDYAAEDAEITLRLHKILKPRLALEKMARVYEDIERPLIPVIARMELTGVKVDQKVLSELSQDFGKRLLALEQEIHMLAGGPFNVASPKQVGEILFGQMGLQGGKKTKTGDWSTAADVLEDLAAQGHKIVQKILDYRQLAKLKSTYTDTLQQEINPKTGRVHTSFHMTGTSTGRLASSDPNLQNIPIRTEEGRRIRSAFVAEPGHILLSVDYSQVELRLAAALAGVAALKQAFRDKVDIHALTASQVFGIPLEQITPEVRRQAKAVNFGIIYGISGWGLAKQLGCDPADANDFIRRYLARFSEIRDYMEAAKDEARKNGSVRTLYGRKCTIPNINNKIQSWRQGAERQAINAPLQGTAADIMKMAMAKLPRELANAGLRAKMLLQVHDELLLEVPEDELETTSILVRNVMQGVVDVGVPLEAEAGSGASWAAAH